jgi:hypothetical protein
VPNTSLLAALRQPSFAPLPKPALTLETKHVDRDSDSPTKRVTSAWTIPRKSVDRVQILVPPSYAGRVSEQPASGSTGLDRLLAAVHIDFAPRHLQPRPAAWLVATAVALGGSLGADAIIVAIGTRVFPATRGFVHFHFSDYGKLTVIGVIVACVGWPIVTRISSAPHWVFSRSAVVVTLVLWLPDLYILINGEPAKAVAVLMAMHLAIAIVTYNALARLAPIGRQSEATTTDTLLGPRGTS